MAIELNPDLGMLLPDFKIEITGIVTNPPAVPDGEKEEED